MAKTKKKWNLRATVDFGCRDIVQKVQAKFLLGNKKMSQDETIQHMVKNFTEEITISRLIELIRSKNNIQEVSYHSERDTWAIAYTNNITTSYVSSENLEDFLENG